MDLTFNPRICVAVAWTRSISDQKSPLGSISLHHSSCHLMPASTLEAVAFAKLLRIHSVQTNRCRRVDSLTTPEPESCEVVMNSSCSSPPNHVAEQALCTVDGDESMSAKPSEGATYIRKTAPPSDHAIEVKSTSSSSQISTRSPTGLQATASKTREVSS